MSEAPEELAFRYATLREICKAVEDWHHLLMNTLIISTFSCSFEDFEKKVNDTYPILDRMNINYSRHLERLEK